MFRMGQTEGKIYLDPELKWKHEEEIMFKVAQERAIEEKKFVYSGLMYGDKRVYVDSEGNRFMLKSGIEMPVKVKSKTFMWILGGLAAVGIFLFTRRK